MVSYHSLTRRELQALCKQHKIPANKTNVFMADALTTLLGGTTNKEVSVEEEAPVMATEAESVGEVSGGTVTDDASKPVAEQAVKKRTERRPAAKKMQANNIPEDLSSAVKPATKRAPLGSKLPKLVNMMTVDAAVNETQDNKATANRRVSPVRKQNAVKKPAKAKSVQHLVSPMTASSDKCSSQPESVSQGPSSEVTAPLSAEKHIVASRPVTVKEAQGGTNETTQQVEKPTTVGAISSVGTNTEVSKAAPVKANECAAAIGKVKSMVSQFEKELSAGTSSSGSSGGGFAVQPSSEKETVPVAENIADVAGGNMLPDGGDVEIGGELVNEVPKVIQTTKTEATKKVGRTKVAPVMKKAVKAKLQSVKVTLSPVQASSPVVTVYRDLNVEEQKLTAEKAGVSKASDDEFSIVPLSPLKTELQNSEISLSLVENLAGEQEKNGGYPCSPLAQSPAGLQPNIPTNIENGGSLFDQENSVMKTENVPQSLRKLRKQVKEKISKVGKIKASGAAVAAAPGRKGAALKEMSLNVLSSGRSIR
ncbi:unnamed protein product [Sphagnum jensenii]|uniref:Uncharacterized protein n=1 Tax=Sphagnum jensenii TaxID=128206 RepID=A0ABP0WIP5_9BRYO